MKLEVIVIPVSDTDRAKDFYVRLGWRLDADLDREDFRLVQFTPPGSGCSIQFGRNLTPAAPGSAQDLYLVVSDLQAARDRLAKATTACASANDLAGAMRRAEAAHGEHEKRIGQADADWPDWYAEYMVAEQAGGELPS